MGKVLDPLDLPSGGKVQFGNPDHLFLGSHFRRLAAIFMPDDDGKVNISRSLSSTDEVLELADIMAESLITWWTLPYMVDAPIPAKDPAVLDRVSWPDKRAIGNYTIGTALELAGIEVRKADGESTDPKGTPSGAPSGSNGVTPGTGSNPSSEPTPPPAEFVTPETLSSLTSPTP